MNGSRGVYYVGVLVSLLLFLLIPFGFFFFKTKKVIFIIIITSGLAHPTSMVSDDDRNYIMFKSNSS